MALCTHCPSSGGPTAVLNRSRNRSIARKGRGGICPLFLSLSLSFWLYLPWVIGAYASGETFSPVMQRENPASLAASDNVWIFGFRGSSFVGNRMLPLVEFFGRWEGEVRIDMKSI